MPPRLPAWHALDLRLMLEGYQSQGAVATSDQAARMETLLSRPPRSCRDVVRDTAAQWASNA